MTEKIKFLNKANVAFGLIGILFMFQFGGQGAWLSFFYGWLVTVINFELIKRIGMLLVPLYAQNTSQTETTNAIENVGNSESTKISPMFWVLLTMKFLFWGSVIALMVFSTKIQGIPFGAGLLSVLISAICLAIKDRSKDVRYA